MSQGELAVVALNRDNRTVLDRGKLAVVDNAIDPTTGTIRLKATFPNSDLKLWPGQFVNARLLITTRTNSLVVPEPAIQRGPQGPFAFVVQPAGTNATVRVQLLKTGPTEAGQVLVEEGLKEGDRVVTEGQYRLQNGTKVRIRPAGQTAESEPDS